MNLGNLKNVIQIQKGLYARELCQYSYLCKDYAKLAGILQSKNPTATALEVEKKYGKFLALASLGNTSFSDSPMNTSLTDSELNILIDYAKHAKDLTTYKEASTYISNSLKFNGNGIYLDTFSLKNYFAFVRKSSSVALKNFHNFNKKNCYSIIGHRNYQLALNSLYMINEIDPSHLPEDIPSLNTNLTPLAFGATIVGYKTTKQLFKNTRNIFESYESKYFARKNSSAQIISSSFKGTKKSLKLAYNIAKSFSSGVTNF